MEPRWYEEASLLQWRMFPIFIETLTAFQSHSIIISETIKLEQNVKLQLLVVENAGQFHYVLNFKV